jgi:hypothetical protein
VTASTRPLVVAAAAVLALALWPVEIHTAFGLPAHPLIIHVPVIFVPLLGLAAIAAAFVPRLRERHGLPLAAFSVVTLVSTLLAVGAGEAFKADQEEEAPPGAPVDPNLAHHAESGEALRIVMVLLTASLVAAVFARKAPRPVQIGLQILVVLLAANAIFWVIRTGHLGSEMAWGPD